MPHLGILVTTYCNLNCRNCADLIPQREKMHYEIEKIKYDVRRVLSVVEEVEEVLIIGGETFLYPHLDELIRFCGEQEKIKKILITTNGRIMPKENVLAEIKNKNVKIRISGYPEFVVENRKLNVEIYKERGIEVEDLENMTWLYMGDSSCRKRTKEQLKNVFESCIMRNCVTLNKEGKLFFCSRQMCAYESENYPEPVISEYVDVRNEDCLLDSLVDFYNLEYISTCDYCDGISCATKKTLPAAIQIMKKEAYLNLLGLYSEWKNNSIINENLLEIIKVLNDNQEYFYDLDEYAVLLNSLDGLEKAQGDVQIENVKLALLYLINRLTKDYQFDVAEEIPFAKEYTKKNRINLISVGDFSSEKADVVITDDELIGAMNEKYPMDGILYNRLFIESKLNKVKRQQVKCIVAGLSYTQYGILEKEMPVNTANVSVTGQDIPYSILMAKKCLELNNSINTVIIPMTYYQGFYDMSSDDATIHVEVMSRINIPLLWNARNYQGQVIWSGYKERETLEFYEEISDLEKLCEVRDQELVSFLEEEDYFNSFNRPNRYGGLKFDFLRLSEQERYESARITAELNERVCTLEAGKEIYEIVNDFLNQMTKENKRVIFFVPPMTDYLYKAYHQELREAYYEKIVPIMKEFNNVTFIDLAEDERFNEYDFSDFEHLNISGAHKLTRILAEYCGC